MLRTAVALALLVVLMGVTGAREAFAGGVYLVDSFADAPIVSGCNDQVPDGDCSLRGAIIVANQDPSIKAIIFDLGVGVPTITPLTPLPDITAPVLMDGGTGGATRINISGASVGISADGLRLVDHAGSTIKNLVINGWSDDGLEITGGGTHTIVSNLIGTNSLGTTDVANSNGIYLVNTTNNVIGGADSDRNVISGNDVNGIRLVEGANDNTVAGNTIGLGLDETTIIGNNTGILSFGSENQIGTAGLRNVIAGNRFDGIKLRDGVNNRVQGNLIGVNPEGQASPNEQYGVTLESSNGPTVIGGSPGNGNVISGNGESGVFIDRSTNIDLSGNIIGLNADGNAPRPNGENGVEVVDTGLAPFGNTSVTTAGVNGVEIGKPGAPNTISGNTGAGILIDGANDVSIRGNNIGVNPDRDTGFGNGLYGINVVSAADNTIGGPDPEDGNLIAAHSGAGIFISDFGGQAEGNDILNNFVGGIPDVAGNGVGIQANADFTDILNNTIVRNTFTGVILSGDFNFVAGNSIGREGIGAAGNGGDGIIVAGNNNYIGPLNPGQGDGPGDSGANAIWDNVGAGVVVEHGTGNFISQNSIGDNFGGGIDLLPLGITPNDTDDPDTGANNRQNFPVITNAGVLPAGSGAVPQGGGSVVSGTLNSNPSTTFELEFFGSESCNFDFPRSGEEYVGSAEVTTNSSGDVEFSIVVSPFLEQGEFVSATASHDDGSTSEFSACIQVTDTVPTPTPTPSPTSGPTGTPTPTASPTAVPGDADCDGDVDMDDFIAALSEVAGVAPGAPCENNVGCGDPIDAQDALDILLYVASPAEFPLPLC